MTRVYISRPFRAPLAEADTAIEALLAKHGYECDGSGSGLGQRDLDFSSTDDAEAVSANDPLWEQLRAEIAQCAGCQKDDVAIFVQDRQDD